MKTRNTASGGGGAANTSTNLVNTGTLTSSGSFVQTPYTITSSQINVAGGEGVVSVAVDTTFTFTGSPVTGEYFAATITNTDTASHLISFPSCVDMITGMAVSTAASRLPAGSVHKYIFQYDGTVYRLYSNTSAAGPQVNSQSAAYTTVLADANNVVEHPGTDTTARTFTIDSNANVPYSLGTKIIMPNQTGAGVLTIAIAGTDTLHLTGTATAGSRTVASGGCAICLKVSTTDWQVGGPGVS